MSTGITLGLTTQDLMLVASDKTECDLEETKIYANPDGSLYKVLSENPRFMGLDQIEDLPTEFGNPETLCSRLEETFGCPLAFHSYELIPTIKYHVK